ncbi:MAG: SAM-dependent methyltransferase [Acidimicrobiaceae bacterium]|nr:SAM-dependent methyltransferase [Acidimicrobiaceae bacterium]
MEYHVRPIAYIRNERSEPLDDNWADVTSTVELAQDVPSEALMGLSAFSHAEIVFFADWAEEVPPGAWHRHPRGNEQWPDVGVFAQRNKDRPNRILLTSVAIDAIGERSFTVRGLDGIDGTPVLDIKPVFRWSVPSGELRVAPWSEELAEGYF